MKAIAYSSKDVAGCNIAEFLIKKGFEISDRIFEGNEIFRKIINKTEFHLIKTDSELVHAEHLNELDYDEIIFISKHKSVSEKPTLTTHVCGNFGNADLGGRNNELSKASAITMLNIFKEIANTPKDEKSKMNYEVSLEATHHGPFIEIPHCWVELGSSEKNWNDLEAAEFLADCVLKGLENSNNSNENVAIGIGGNHYCSVFTKHEGEYAFGHIIPKYSQKNLDKKMIEKMIKSTFPEPKFIVIDKKGIGKLSEVKKLAESIGLKTILL